MISPVRHAPEWAVISPVRHSPEWAGISPVRYAAEWAVISPVRYLWTIAPAWGGVEYITKMSLGV